jgi:hypothetical protein
MLSPLQIPDDSQQQQNTESHHSDKEGPFFLFFQLQIHILLLE